MDGANGGSIDSKYHYIIPGNLTSTIFSQMVVKVNDVEIANHNHYPHLCKFLLMAHVPAERRQLLHDVGEFYGTDGYDITKGSEVDEKTKKVSDAWDADADEFKNLKNRSAAFAKTGGSRKGVVSVSSYLLTDFAVGDRSLVFPPCNITIDFIPNDAAKSILTTHLKPNNLKVEIQSAYLTVPRILPKADVIPRSLQWNYLRLRVSPLIVGKGSSEFHAVVLHSGTLGRRISLMAIDTDNWEGNFRQSIYRSTPHSIESVQFQVGSKTIPTSRIKADFSSRDYSEMYLYCMESLRFSLAKSGASELLKKKAWTTGGDFLFVADTSVDQTAGAGLQGGKESGSVSLNVAFSKPLAKNTVLLIFTENTAELTIQPSGAVTLKE